MRKSLPFLWPTESIEVWTGVITYHWIGVTPLIFCFSVRVKCLFSTWHKLSSNTSTNFGFVKTISTEGSTLIVGGLSLRSCGVFTAALGAEETILLDYSYIENIWHIHKSEMYIFGRK